MKLITTTLLLVHFVCFSFAQDEIMNYAVRPTYKYPVNKATLNTAKTINDINPGYPASWVSGYISAEILVTCNGILKKAISVNDTLSQEQMEILKLADLGSDVVVDVKYNPKNSGLEADLKKVHFSYTVVPKKEAQFPGGAESLQQFLKENIIDKTPEALHLDLQQATVTFTVDETGAIINPQVTNSSKQENIDKKLLEVLQNMPQWEPAENLDGTKVSQEFKLEVGHMVGC